MYYYYYYYQQQQYLAVCRHSGSGSQGRKRKLQPVDTAVSSHREGSCQDSGGPLHNPPKRPRSVPQAHAASPHFRGTPSVLLYYIWSIYMSLIVLCRSIVCDPVSDTRSQLQVAPWCPFSCKVMLCVGRVMLNVLAGDKGPAKSLTLGLSQQRCISVLLQAHLWSTHISLGSLIDSRVICVFTVYCQSCIIITSDRAVQSINQPII